MLLYIYIYIYILVVLVKVVIMTSVSILIVIFIPSIVAVLWSMRWAGFIYIFWWLTVIDMSERWSMRRGFLDRSYLHFNSFCWVIIALPIFPVYALSKDVCVCTVKVKTVQVRGVAPIIPPCPLEFHSTIFRMWIMITIFGCERLISVSVECIACISYQKAFVILLRHDCRVRL